MLRQLNQWSGNITAKILLGFLIISFAAWGVTDFLVGRNSTTALQVNGEPISVFELDRVYRQLNQQVASQFGGVAVPPQIAAQLNLPGQALTDVIRDKILEDVANDMGFAIHDAQLLEEIQSMPGFQDEQGQFSRNQYLSLLDRAGYTPDTYEQTLRDELKTDYLNEIFTGAIANPIQAQRMLMFDRMQLDLTIQPITTADVRGVAAVADASVSAVYERQIDRFQTPELRNVSFVILPANDAQYDQQVALEDALAGGESLIDAANANDIALTTLAEVAANDNRLQAQIRQAMQTLSNGEVSQAIELPADAVGFVQVNEITPPSQLSLAEVEADIRATLRAQRQIEALQQLTIEALQTARSTGLNQAQSQHGLRASVQRLNEVSRSSDDLPQWLGDRAFNALLGLQNGEVLGIPLRDEAGFYLVRLNSKQTPQLDAGDLQEMQATLTLQLVNDLRWLFLYNQFTDVRVTYNLPVLRQVFGGDFSSEQVPVAPRQDIWRFIPFVN